MAFVNGYIIVMSKELPHIKALMLTHLLELMEDGNITGGQQSRLTMQPGAST